MEAKPARFVRVARLDRREGRVDLNSCVKWEGKLDIDFLVAEDPLNRQENLYRTNSGRWIEELTYDFTGSCYMSLAFPEDQYFEVSLPDAARWFDEQWIGDTDAEGKPNGQPVKPQEIVDFQQSLDLDLDASCELESTARTPPPSTPVQGLDTPTDLPDLVTLDQAAAAVNRKKRTLERRKTNGKLPPPSVEGGGGKPDFWDWSTIRPWLESEFSMKLPDRYPRLR
jgi:hypothetical protein